MRERKERIQLNDTMAEVYHKLSDDNFGALNVLKQLMSKGADIDPDCGMGESFLMLLHLDSQGVYGDKLWMLYKDVAGENLSKAWACIRACQLGFISNEVLHHAINNGGAGLNLNEVCKQVKDRLPKFQVQE